VKSQGYKIRRSGQQTDAGAGFWGKHRPGENVWEQGVSEVKILSKVKGIGNNQSDANRHAARWLADNGYGSGTEVEVVPEVR